MLEKVILSFLTFFTGVSGLVSLFIFACLKNGYIKYCGVGLTIYDERQMYALNSWMEKHAWN